MTSGYRNVLAEFKYIVNTYRDNVSTCNLFSAMSEITFAVGRRICSVLSVAETDAESDACQGQTGRGLKLVIRT
jgi:hypothetical protein